MPSTTRPNFLLSSALGVGCALLLGSTISAADLTDADKDFFTKQVWPIIKTNCTGCHGPEKHKAKLRLDSRAGWLKGGEDGEILVVGDPDKSDVVLAIKHQSKDPDDYMPPKKKTQLTDAQVAIISDWIKRSLPWPDDTK
jgi:mono/diheme cytochrome c family protein